MGRESVRVDKIVFEDGRRGTQRVLVAEDGQETLLEIVVRQLADGTRCRHVYALVSDPMADVFSLASLAPARWDVS